MTFREAFQLLISFGLLLTVSLLIYGILKTRVAKDNRSAIYLCLYVATSLASDFGSYLTESSFHIVTIQTIFTIGELTFFTSYLASILRLKFKAFCYITAGLILMMFLLNLQHFEQYRNFCFLIFLESLFLTGLCLIYFRGLFSRSWPNDLLNSFDYWVVIGAFIYFGALIPLYFYRSVVDRPPFDVVLHLIASVLNLVMLSVYFKAFSCLKKVPS
jgi:hypothetical protein